VKLKRNSRICVIVFTTLVGILFAFIPDIRFVFSIVVGMFTVCISLFANYVKEMLLGSSLLKRGEVTK